MLMYVYSLYILGVYDLYDVVSNIYLSICSICICFVVVSTKRTYNTYNSLLLSVLYFLFLMISLSNSPGWPNNSAVWIRSINRINAIKPSLYHILYNLPHQLTRLKSINPNPIKYTVEDSDAMTNVPLME